MLKLHKSLVDRWSKKLNTKNEQIIFDNIIAILIQHLDSSDYSLLGTGGEGFVFKDNGLVKKFINNWDEKRTSIDMIYKNLSILSKIYLPSKRVFLCLSGTA